MRVLPYFEHQMGEAYQPGPLRKLKLHPDYYNATGALPYHAAA